MLIGRVQAQFGDLGDSIGFPARVPPRSPFRSRQRRRSGTTSCPPTASCCDQAGPRTQAPRPPGPLPEPAGHHGRGARVTLPRRQYSRPAAISRRPRADAHVVLAHTDPAISGTIRQVVQDQAQDASNSRRLLQADVVAGILDQMELAPGCGGRDGGRGAGRRRSVLITADNNERLVPALGEPGPVRAAVERPHAANDIGDVLLESDSASALNDGRGCPGSEERRPVPRPGLSHAAVS